MRRFPALFTTPKPHPSSPTAPNNKVKSNSHSDALWNLYQELIDPDSSSFSSCPSSSDDPNNSGIYYVSDTILDLDADKSPATRPYTSADHEEQIKKWGTNHRLDALTKRMHAFRDEISDAKLHWRRKLGLYDERRITERDILAMALLGPVSDGDKRERGNGALSCEFLERIGIYRRITGTEDKDKGDIPLTVRYLVHRMKTQRTQGQPLVQVQAQSSNSDDAGQLASTQPDERAASTSPPDMAGQPAQQNQKQKQKKPKTKAQELRHLKSVLRKSNPQSIPRVLYPLLNNGHGRALVAECSEEIISGMTKETNNSPAQTADADKEKEEKEEEEEKESAIRARIFLKNLAYNLVKRGDLVLPENLTSVWSKALEQPQGRTTALPTADPLVPSEQQLRRTEEQSHKHESPPCANPTAPAGITLPEEPGPEIQGHVVT